jgi:copper chaperone CopZ
MKIKVESGKIIKAVKKLDGVEIVVENAVDAKEAIKLILRKQEIFKAEDYGNLEDFNVTAFQEYKTSAVDYKVVFLLEFLFSEQTSLDEKVRALKSLQDFFDKA